MAIYRLRRRRRWRRPSILLLSAALLTVGAWWTFFREGSPTSNDGTLASAPRPALTTDRPEITPEARPRAGVTEKGETETADLLARTNTPGSISPRAESLVAGGRQALERGELVTARTYLGEALKLGLDASEATLVRAELARIGNETVFSPRIFENDPLVGRYVVKPGDTLGKIAKAHKVSSDLLADINGIANKHLIRVGQTIKIVEGPFRAVVDKAGYSLDVYLDTTYVKCFKVGLGTDDSTPSGVWSVGTKLINPTYYPPRGGPIIAADDPENPLGERWIGLLGVSGGAVGQRRYGIHGTIDPESIGQNVSMGCIRLYNEDVEALYTYLVEKHSTVTVRN